MSLIAPARLNIIGVDTHEHGQKIGTVAYLPSGIVPMRAECAATDQKCRFLQHRGHQWGLAYRAWSAGCWFHHQATLKPLPFDIMLYRASCKFSGAETGR